MVSYAYWQNLNLCSWGCFEPLTTWVLNGETRATRATKKKKELGRWLRSRMWGPPAMCRKRT